MLSSQVELTQATQQQQRLLPDNFNGLIRRLGQELSCAICLGVLSEPVLTPCYHAFCRDCVERMLRVAQKTDAPCPICKNRITRRSMATAGTWAGLVETFNALVRTFEEETGRKWDDPDDDNGKTDNSHSEIPTTQEIQRLRAEEERLNRELEEVEVLIRRHQLYGESSSILSSSRGSISKLFRPPPIAPQATPTETDTLALIDDFEFPSSPDDLFAKISTQQLQFNGLPATIDSDPRQIVFATSLIKSGEQAELIDKFMTVFSRTACKEGSFNPKVTHLIIPTATRIAKRTQKYLLAMLNGIWIVTLDWVRESIKTGQMVDEAAFEVVGDENYPGEEGPRRARLSRAGRESPLLCGYSFYLYGVFVAPTRHDLKDLISTAGGSILEDVDDLSQRRGVRSLGSGKTIVLCDPKEQADFEKDAGIISKFKPLLSSTWLLDCISAFQIVDATHHIVL